LNSELIMIFKNVVALLFFAIFLSACAVQSTAGTGSTPEPPGPDTPVTSPPDPTGEEPIPAPWEPKPGDESMSRGEAFVSETDMLVLESFPVQYVLQLSGSLPTPCHQLRVDVSEPDEQNRIQLEVYSLVDPNEVCIQVLEPFEANINLGSFSDGSYTIWVNGEQAGEIAP
jgi:hypothetical protein